MRRSRCSLVVVCTISSALDGGIQINIAPTIVAAVLTTDNLVFMSVPPKDSVCQTA